MYLSLNKIIFWMGWCRSKKKVDIVQKIGEGSVFECLRLWF